MSTAKMPGGRWRVLRPRYSLSTLFLVTAAFAAYLGCQARWIHQRHAFLDELAARTKAAWHGKEIPNMDFYVHLCIQRDAGLQPPWPLAFFGEKGASTLYVTIPDDDVRSVIVPFDEDGLLEVTQLETDTSQPDLVRAKRLFPEAEVHPIQWSDYIPTDGTGRGFCELKVVKKDQVENPLPLQTREQTR